MDEASTSGVVRDDLDVARRWLVEVIETQAVPAGNGTWRVTATQAQLAELAGLKSEGTVQERVKRLRKAGLVVSTRPLVVLHPDEPGPEARSVVVPFPHAEGIYVDRAVPGDAWVQPLLEANRRIAESLELGGPAAHLVDAQTALLKALSEVAGTRIETRGSAPREAADDRGNAVGGRVGREVVGDEPVDKKNLTNSPQTATTRGRGSTADRGPVSAEDRARVLEAIEPLASLCKRLNKTGVTDEAGVVAALAEFETDQIRHAVSMVCKQTRDNADIHSPFGLLVRKAQANDANYFPADPPRRPRPAEPEPAPRSAPDHAHETKAPLRSSDPKRPYRFEFDELAEEPARIDFQATRDLLQRKAADAAAKRNDPGRVDRTEENRRIIEQAAARLREPEPPSDDQDGADA